MLVIVSRMDDDSIEQALHGPLYGLPVPDPQDSTLGHFGSPGDLRHAIDIRRSLLQQDLRYLAALRNATLPINQLPNEIFVEILVLARFGDEGVGIYNPYPYANTGRRTVGSFHWMPLMGVCRRWWAIARATPRLWRSIDVYTNTNWLQLCLRRAPNATLELSLHDAETAIDLAHGVLPSVSNRISCLLLPSISSKDFALILPFLNQR